MGASVVYFGDGGRWALELPADTRVIRPDTDSIADVLERTDVRCVVYTHDGGTDRSIGTFAESVRNVDATVPILAVSDSTDGDLAIDAYRAGVTEYVSRERLAADGETVHERIEAICTDGRDAPHDPETELRRQTDALERLYQITSDRSRTFEEKVADLLELGCDRLGLEVGYLSRIEDDRFQLMDSRGAEELLESLGRSELLGADGTLPLDRTYCRRTVERGELSGFARGADGTEWGSDPAYEMFGLESYLGGPVVVDDELYGTLCFADEKPRGADFTDAERTFVELTVEWLSQEFEREKYDTERRETARRLERTFNRVSDAVFAVDDEWAFTHLNSHAEQLLGREAEELIGTNVWEEFSAALGDRYETEYRRAMRTQEPVSFEEYYEPLDLWTEVNAYPSDDGLSVFFRDITDRKRREQTLRGLLETSRELFRTEDEAAIAETIVEASVDILDFDINGVHLYDDGTETLRCAAASEAVVELIGEPPTYDVGDGLVGSVFENGRSEVYGDISSVDSYDYGPVRSAIAVPLGTYGVFSVGTETADAFDESDISIIELLATSAAEALDRAARLRTLRTYETVLESVDDMIYVLDEDDRITHLTAPFSAWLGYERESLVGEPITTVLPEFERAIRDRSEGTENDRATPTETVVKTASGEHYPVEVTISALSEGGREQRIVGSVDDIGKLAETRAELTTEQARFRELFERIPDPVVEATLRDGTLEVEGVNSAFESVFGYDESAVVGRSINAVIVPQRDRETAASLDETIRNEGVATKEVSRRTQTGIRQFLFRGFLYQSGDVDRAFGIYTDITERNERERYLRVTNRIIRHNLRNDLNVIKGFTEILRDDLEEETHIEYAERILETADGLAALGEDANELRRVVGQNLASELRSVELEPFIESARRAVEDQFPDARIEQSIPPSTTGRVDERFETVIEYLLENGIEHNDAEDPTVSVTTAEATTEGFIEVHVADNGTGIPRPTSELIVGEREITQLEHTIGTGLWVVKWVVESYGGEIRFEPSNDGTRVVLRVPT